MMMRMEAASRLRAPLRAFRSRNYRLFFAGQGISLVGTWLTQVAMSWLVYRLTHAPATLGLVVFLGRLPTFLLAPLAGVVADHADRRRILLWTQALAMVESLLLAWLALSGRIAVWHIMALSVCQGLVDGFDIPTRQAFVIEIVDSKDTLANAIALNSFMFNAARFLGPCLAGVLIAAVGEGGCFLLDGISYLAVLASLAALRMGPRSPRASRPRLLAQLAQGVAYAWRNRPIAWLLALLAWMSLTGMSYAVLMPVVAKEVLHGNPQTYGLLMAASGLGALGGAGFLAMRHSGEGFGRLIAMAAALSGASLLLMAGSRSLWWSSALLASAGFWFMVHAAATNTVLQTLVEDDKRGSVMSLFVTAFMGAMPVGSLLAGHLAEAIGAPATIAAAGACCLLGGVVMARSMPRLQLPTAAPLRSA